MPPGTLCHVAGWGVVSHAGRRPDVLQTLTVPIMDRNTCNQRVYHDGAVTKSMMCAESNRRDSCRVSGKARVKRCGWVEPEGLQRPARGVACRKSGVQESWSCSGLAIGRVGLGYWAGTHPTSWPHPTGRLRWPSGVRKHGRGYCSVGLASLWKPKEAGRLYPRVDVHRLDRKRH